MKDFKMCGKYVCGFSYDISQEKNGSKNDRSKGITR